jgi:hypothetical protein
MQITRQFIVFLLLVASPYAYARGGPAGAFAAMLEMVLIAAIIIGIVVGATVGRVVRRIPWKSIAAISIVLLGVGIAFPMVGAFICLPLGVVIAISASVADIVRSSFVEQAAESPLFPVAANRRIEWWPGALRNTLRWIAGTYVFWAVVSLFSFELLSFLVIPPLVFAFPKIVVKFMPFLFLPLTIAVVIGVIGTALYYYKKRGTVVNHYRAVLVFNVCVLVSFFASAEVYRDHLMSQALDGHKPVNLYSVSFTNSVLSYHTYFRGQHASFTENGKTYNWSYAERRFFQVR